MSEEKYPLVADSRTLGKWEQHRFMLLIAITITVALFLVGISLALYNSSGTAQLDLSRPGFQSVRNQASNSEEFTGFSASGELDKAAADQFRSLYDKQIKKVTTVDSFSGEVLEDKALQIDPLTAE